MNPIIKAFDTKNLSQIVDFVKPMWSFSEWEDNFRRFYVEIILRKSFFTVKNFYLSFLFFVLYSVGVIP